MHNQLWSCYVLLLAWLVLYVLALIAFYHCFIQSFMSTSLSHIIIMSISKAAVSKTCNQRKTRRRQLDNSASGGVFCTVRTYWLVLIGHVTKFAGTLGCYRVSIFDNVIVTSSYIYEHFLRVTV